MSSNYTVSLPGTAPWGFRLQGGKDFSAPLTISKLTDGGKAAKASMSVGDVVLSIDGVATDRMNHLEAQNKIKACAGNLQLTLQRASSVPKADVVPKEKPQEIIKPVPITQQAPPPAFTSSSAQPSAACNKTARPFPASSGAVTSSVSAPRMASIPSASSAFTPAASSQNVPLPPVTTRSPALTPARPSGARSPFAPPPSSSPARVTAPPSNPVAPQPSVYNTPINLYSNHNAVEVAMGQRRGLLESQGVVEQHNGLAKMPQVAPAVSPTPPSDTMKRILEDTEDWNHRSGTSQSRSFRILAQITGTENEQSQDVSAGRKDDAPPIAHVTTSAKTMTKASPIHTKTPPVLTKTPPVQTKTLPVQTKTAPVQSKSPWQAGGSPGLSKGASPGPQATPSFGHISTSAGTKAPEWPAPQSHPKDQNSLVQRAEHIPAGTRTPMCGQCNMVIRGPFLVAMGKSWHPEEFTCTHCHTSLAEAGFVEEGGSVYCSHCYEQFFAPTCTHCHKKILGEVINALKQTWHNGCFLCASCHRPIGNNTFHLEDGLPYCEKDYYNIFGTSCHGCDFPIEAGDKFLEALGFTWHDTCFVCAVCSTSLEGQAFFSKKDKALCKKHAHAVQI